MDIGWKRNIKRPYIRTSDMLQAINVMNTDGLLWTCSCETWTEVQISSQVMKPSKVEALWSFIRPSNDLTSGICRTTARTKWVLPPHCKNARSGAVGTNPASKRHQSIVNSNNKHHNRRNLVKKKSDRGLKQFISPIAAWTVSRIAQVCRTPFNQKKRESIRPRR